MALKKVKGNFERIFDKNLTDLVRGIRNNKDNEVILWEFTCTLKNFSPPSHPLANKKHTEGNNKKFQRKQKEKKTCKKNQVPYVGDSKVE